MRAGQSGLFRQCWGEEEEIQMSIWFRFRSLGRGSLVDEEATRQNFFRRAVSFKKEPPSSIQNFFWMKPPSILPLHEGSSPEGGPGGSIWVRFMCLKKFWRVAPGLGWGSRRELPARTFSEGQRGSFRWMVLSIAQCSLASIRAFHCHSAFASRSVFGPRNHKISRELLFVCVWNPS
jgi:hypothetical protein